jgi:hypothetical protein
VRDLRQHRAEGKIEVGLAKRVAGLRKLHLVYRALKVAHVLALGQLAQLARLRLERSNVRKRGFERVAAVGARPAFGGWDVARRAALDNAAAERVGPLAEVRQQPRRCDQRVARARGEEG